MINKITNIIKNHMEVISHLVTGQGNPDKGLLNKLGITSTKDLLTTAYELGKSKFSNTPTTTPQQELLAKMKQKSQQFFTGLSQKIITGVKTTLLNSEIISQRLNKPNEPFTGLNLTQLKSDIKRIINTEVWSTKTQGEVDGILEHRESTTKVKIIPHTDACPQCKRLYLDDNNNPKIFTLEELLNNGNNTGLKQEDWVATLPPCHPHCRCKMETIHGR